MERFSFELRNAPYKTDDTESGVLKHSCFRGKIGQEKVLLTHEFIGQTSVVLSGPLSEAWADISFECKPMRSQPTNRRFGCVA